jgi:hypothetical protein
LRFRVTASVQVKAAIALAFDEREVLTERARRQRPIELGLPPRVVLAGTGVHRLVGTAMNRAVGLRVTGEVNLLTAIRPSIGSFRIAVVTCAPR